MNKIIRSVDTAKRLQQAKNSVSAAIPESHGNQGVICRKAGVTPHVLKAIMAAYPLIAQAIQDERDMETLELERIHTDLAKGTREVDGVVVPVSERTQHSALKTALEARHTDYGAQNESHDGGVHLHIDAEDLPGSIDRLIQFLKSKS